MVYSLVVMLLIPAPKGGRLKSEGDDAILATRRGGIDGPFRQVVSPPVPVAVWSVAPILAGGTAVITAIALKVWRWFGRDPEWSAWGVLIASPFLVLVCLEYLEDPLGFEAQLRFWWWRLAIMEGLDFWIYRCLRPRRRRLRLIVSP